MIAGVDLSSVQGALTSADFATLRSRGTRFAVAKCGNGNQGMDPRCATDVAAARAAGLIVGVYHFPFALRDDPAHPARDPVQQARLHYVWASRVVQDGDLVEFADAEWPRPEQWGKPIPNVDSSEVDADFLREWFVAYLEEYSAQRGRAMGIYFDEWFMRNLKPDGRYAAHPPWIAAYGPRVPPIPPWAGWSVWQTSGGGGRLPDGAPVDTDAIADEATLAMLRIGAAAA